MNDDNDVNKRLCAHIVMTIQVGVDLLRYNQSRALFRSQWRRVTANFIIVPLAMWERMSLSWKHVLWFFIHFVNVFICVITCYNNKIKCWQFYKDCYSVYMFIIQVTPKCLMGFTQRILLKTWHRSILEPKVAGNKLNHNGNKVRLKCLLI